MKRPSGRLLVAVDFDGTLVPIRKNPAAVRLSAGRRALLRRLARAPGVRLLVVSGRPQAFLRRAFAGVDAALAGEHGWVLEGVGPAWRHEGLSSRAREARAIAKAARRAVGEFSGVCVELKKTAVAVHWRAAPSVIHDPAPLHRLLTALLPQGWRLAGGKRIFEFRPADPWGKGDAVTMAARRLKAKAVFIGDDVTDEEAFLHLGRSAMTVKVGPGPTLARERVAGLAGVDTVLRGLAKI